MIDNNPALEKWRVHEAVVYMQERMWLMSMNDATDPAVYCEAKNIWERFIKVVIIYNTQSTQVEAGYGLVDSHGRRLSRPEAAAKLRQNLLVWAKLYKKRMSELPMQAHAESSGQDGPTYPGSSPK